MKKLLYLISCLSISCGLVDEGWGVTHKNNSDYAICCYVNHYIKNGKYYLKYDGLTEELSLGVIEPHSQVERSFWPPAPSFKNGSLMHVYAFSPDTLARYSWDEVVEQKKYWFGEVICNRRNPINFPEDFEYMGGTAKECSSDRSNVVP